MRTHHTSPGCGGDCSHCSIGDHTPVEGELTGWRLGLAACGMFLGPLVLAIVGALLAGPTDTGQFLGGVTGLAVGAVAAVWTGRRLRRWSKENQ